MHRAICRGFLFSFVALSAPGAPPARAQTATALSAVDRVTLAESECTAANLAAPIPPSAIGEPVRAVTIEPPAWVAATETVSAHCRIDGSFAPVDASVTAKPINFRVLLPASWSRRAAQIGGGGTNGTIPSLGAAGAGPGGPSLLPRGFATYGSDSGHQTAPGGRGGSAAAGGADWAINEESIKNFAYMQMKKTHDAAMIVIERAYGSRPRFNYYIGTSQGGREAFTVAQRYPQDYNGIAANVPVVNFSTLMLAPALIRIQEKPLANWVTPAKVNAIRQEFMRQCDGLDGFVDGLINNYMACRATFDVTQGARNRQPWAAKRCPSNIDPNPQDTSAGACLTDGQIATLHVVYSRYSFATPLAHNVKSFGMWVPNTDPSGSGLMSATRFRAQEGAPPDAPMHTSLGSVGVVGFLMKDLSANPLDYVEGGPLNRRREELSKYVDATDPDLTRFYRRGGKIIAAIGTNDTLASPGAQLDYFQSVIDKMGRATVDRFARFYVLPQTGHGLSGSNDSVDGEGRTIPVAAIPNTYDRLGRLFDWVEKGIAPGNVTVTAAERSLPLCTYPDYPRYVSGPATSAASYRCAR